LLVSGDGIYCESPALHQLLGATKWDSRFSARRGPECPNATVNVWAPVAVARYVLCNRQANKIHQLFQTDSNHEPDQGKKMSILPTGRQTAWTRL
jgi:hypothetical protein